MYMYHEKIVFYVIVLKMFRHLVYPLDISLYIIILHSSYVPYYQSFSCNQLL
jgi:hypothetical protein